VRLALPPEQIEAPDAESEEQHSHQVAECRSAVYRSHDDQRDPDPHEKEREERHESAVGVQAALRPATTITLLGACLRTKSTVSLKTPRPLPPRGAPMTMISL
jgi:hypothetical protein